MIRRLLARLVCLRRGHDLRFLRYAAVHEYRAHGAALVFRCAQCEAVRYAPGRAVREP